MSFPPDNPLPLKDAAHDLHAYFNDPHGFTVGVGSDRLFVYLRRKKDLPAVPSTWNGWPVETRVTGGFEIKRSKDGGI